MKTKNKHQDEIQDRWIGYAQRYMLASAKLSDITMDMFKQNSASQTYSTLMACVYEIDKLLEFHPGTNSQDEDYQHGHFDGLWAARDAITKIKPLEVKIDE